ncbi:hypothetical protein CRYUN_Cryun36dG0007200 [Craigia yunnanensis]
MAAIGGNLPVPAPANVYTPLSNPIVVIGEQFLAPYPVDLKIQQKVSTLAENNFDITDVNDSYGVTANPNVDYGFIVSMVVAFDEMNADRSGEDCT